jgi:hypothetical protein
MTYIDPTIDTAEKIDHVRLTGFQRSGSRPVGKLRRPPSEMAKTRQRASGRLRTAVYRCNLDTKRKPESSVVGMALLAAVVTQASLKSFDAASVSIVTAAFADLQERGAPPVSSPNHRPRGLALFPISVEPASGPTKRFDAGPLNSAPTTPAA